MSRVAADGKIRAYRIAAYGGCSARPPLWLTFSRVDGGAYRLSRRLLHDGLPDPQYLRYGRYAETREYRVMSDEIRSQASLRPAAGLRSGLAQRQSPRRSLSLRQPPPNQSAPHLARRVTAAKGIARPHRTAKIITKATITDAIEINSTYRTLWPLIPPLACVGVSSIFVIGSLDHKGLPYRGRDSGGSIGNYLALASRCRLIDIDLALPTTLPAASTPKPTRLRPNPRLAGRGGIVQYP